MIIKAFDDPSRFYTKYTIGLKFTTTKYMLNVHERKVRAPEDAKQNRARFILHEFSRSVNSYYMNLIFGIVETTCIRLLVKTLKLAEKMQHF